MKERLGNDMQPHIGQVRAKVTDGIYKFDVPCTPDHVAQARRDFTEVITQHDFKIKGVFPKKI